VPRFDERGLREAAANRGEGSVETARRRVGVVGADVADEGVADCEVGDVPGEEPGYEEGTEGDVAGGLEAEVVE
jgi:hypothetical protein